MRSTRACATSPRQRHLASPARTSGICMEFGLEARLGWRPAGVGGPSQPGPSAGISRPARDSTYVSGYLAHTGIHLGQRLGGTPDVNQAHDQLRGAPRTHAGGSTVDIVSTPNRTVSTTVSGASATVREMSPTVGTVSASHPAPPWCRRCRRCRRSRPRLIAGRGPDGSEDRQPRVTSKQHPAKLTVVTAAAGVDPRAGTNRRVRGSTPSPLWLRSALRRHARASPRSALC